MEWDVGQVLNRRFQCYLRGWKLSIWISFKMNVLTDFPLKKVHLYFFYPNFQGDNLSRYGLQNNAVIYKYYFKRNKYFLHNEKYV